MFGSNPEQLRSLAAWLLEQEVEEVVIGIDGAILETGVGSAGTALETATPEERRRKPEVGNAAFGTGAIQSHPATPNTRLSDRTTKSSALQSSTGAVIFDPVVIPNQARLIRARSVDNRCVF